MSSVGSRRSNVGARGAVSPLGRLRYIDPILLFVGLALGGFGILAVYVAETEGGETYAANQALGFVVGLVGAVPLALFDYRKLRAYLPLVYGLAVFMLLVVTVLGMSAKGAQRWIDVGPVQVQPSEFAKLLVVVVLAGYLADNRISDNTNFLKSLGILGVPTFLVFMQPDLGSALVFGAVFFAMAFVGGAKLYQLGALVAAGLLAAGLALYLGVLADYQVARLTAFMEDPTGVTDVGYQVFQSKIAIGSGGVTGKGIEEAMTLSNLGFLPEDHTDFIFSNLAERLGFAGAGLLLGLFAVLVWRMLHVSSIARDRFGTLIAVGIATIFLFHTVVNIGMTMGIMPVTGIPLPFVSYGRSSLVVSVLALGLLQSIVVRAKSEGYRTPGA